MGVKLLSKFLKQECRDIVKHIHLSELYGKKICIDTSIYMYRYKTTETMIENFYLMCSIFKKYNIIPIFVFDGTPPEQKKGILEERRKNRHDAWVKYEEMLEKYGNNIPASEKDKFNKIKRNLIKIKRQDIENLKNLFNSYGIQHITANGEADKLCAALVIKKKVHAVLTEDMDLFAYNCPYILRYFSLAHHKCLYYDVEKILEKLKLTKNQFQLICILSGNDYYSTNRNIFYYMKLHKKYLKKHIKKDFKEWLLENEILTNTDIYEIQNIKELYNITEEIKQYPYKTISYKSVDVEQLQNILKLERFVF